jgi:hypothetical protein
MGADHAMRPRRARQLSLDPSIIVDASASWGEPGTIGRVSMWWTTWVRGRSVLAKGHGGEAPRESVDPGSGELDDRDDRADHDQHHERHLAPDPERRHRRPL